MISQMIVAFVLLGNALNLHLASVLCWFRLTSVLVCNLKITEI